MLRELWYDKKLFRVPNLWALDRAAESLVKNVKDRRKLLGLTSQKSSGTRRAWKMFFVLKRTDMLWCKYEILQTRADAFWNWFWSDIDTD